MRLKGLRIDAIALVDKGDNPLADITLFKRKGGAMPEKDTELTALQKQLDEMKATLGKQTERADAAEKQAAALTERLEGKPADPLAKATPEVRKALDDLQKRTEAAEKESADGRAIVAKMKAEADREKFVKRAADFPSFGVADDLGAVLLKMHNALDATEFESLTTRWKAIEAQLAAGELFKTASGDNAPEGSAEAKAEQLAREIVSKRDGFSYEQALGEVWEKNPELYSQYVQEHGSYTEKDG